MHGLLTSKNFSVVTFAIAFLAALKVLSCCEDHDQTTSTWVNSVRGLYDFSKIWRKARHAVTQTMQLLNPLSHLAAGSCPQWLGRGLDVV